MVSVANVMQVWIFFLTTCFITINSVKLIIWKNKQIFRANKTLASSDIESCKTLVKTKLNIVCFNNRIHILDLWRH